MKFSLLPEQLPQHIAIIMDGNRRWAKKRFLPSKVGHREGVKTIHRIAGDIFDLNIPYLTLYAFSTENKNRPKDEVDALFLLMEEFFSEIFDELLKKNISLRFMGDLNYFPPKLKNLVITASEKSKDFNHGILNIALNYGARDEILRAVNLAVKSGKEITLSEFDKLLFTNGIPEPDIILRTGGESRLSNFMLYQAAYSELFFTKTLWPDFSKNELYKILTEYAKRDRRFGKV